MPAAAAQLHPNELGFGHETGVTNRTVQYELPWGAKRCGKELRSGGVAKMPGGCKCLLLPQPIGGASCGGLAIGEGSGRGGDGYNIA